jgi:hypothetical protein
VAFAASEEGQSNEYVQNAYKELQTVIKSKEDTSVDKVSGALGYCVDIFYEKSGFGEWIDGGGVDATQAFSDIMSAAAAAKVTPEDMKNGTLFTEGKGMELFNNYLTNAEMISGMTDEEFKALQASASAEGNVVVSYCQNATMVEIANTITES